MFQTRLNSLVWTVLVLHTLYIVAVLRTPSPNLFSALKIPINTSTEAIRSLLQQSAKGALPEYLNTLLDHIDSFERRSLYVRFGHNVIVTCEHCRATEDYVLYALPRPALAYLREIALIGLVTLEKLHRSHLRAFGVAILVAAFVAETYSLGTAPISIPPPGVHIRAEDMYMWHDRLLTYRHLLFLVLPMALAILPSLLMRIAHSPTLYPILARIPFVSLFIKHPLTPLASLNILRLQPQMAADMPPSQLKSYLIQSSLRTLDHLIPSIHLYRLTHAGVMRDPNLRERAAAWWVREKEETNVILRDEAVKKAARAEDLAFDEAVKPEETAVVQEMPEGKLRTTARMAVEGLFKQGLMPSEHWVQSRMPKS